MLSRPVNSDEYLGGEGCINLVCQQACERVASILYPQARLPWSPFYHLFFLIFQTTTPTEVWPWRLFLYFIFSHCERPVLLWDPFHILQTLYYTFVSYSSNTLLHIRFIFFKHFTTHCVLKHLQYVFFHHSSRQFRRKSNFKTFITYFGKNNTNISYN